MYHLEVQNFTGHPHFLHSDQINNDVKKMRTSKTVFYETSCGNVSDLSWIRKKLQISNYEWFQTSVCCAQGRNVNRLANIVLSLLSKQHQTSSLEDPFASISDKSVQNVQCIWYVPLRFLTAGEVLEIWISFNKYITKNMILSVTLLNVECSNFLILST